MSAGRAMHDTRVYKYTLPLGDWVSIRMPEDAQPLHIDMQHGQPQLWARVKVDSPPVTHHFRIAGTGHALGSNIGRHIGSFQMESGALVFHVFAEPDRDREIGPRRDADARLIAAAPDLLAACVAHLIDRAEAGCTSESAAVTRMRAAIAKATGAAS